MEELRKEAKTLFERNVRDPADFRRDGQSGQWTKMLMKSGTLADRIASLTLSTRRSPRSRIEGLVTLQSMLKKKSRRESLMALDALSALYKSDLLPSDRKLIALEKQPRDKLQSLAKAQREELMSQWYLEDAIKIQYSDFLLELEALLKDQMETTRLKALGVVFDLLMEKPEREDRLLAMLVNKFGDLQKKVASKACGFLVRLLRQHPNMKLVVVDEVERLLYRTNISPKAQYYAICFLIQIKLADKDFDLAVKLVKIYFSLFKVVTSKKAANPKMLSAILTGVNRTYPFTRGPQNLIEYIDTFFRYIHTVSAQIGIQILMLLYQVMEREGAITDRFYMALYRKMMDLELLNHAGRSSSLLNLLYKAMKRDTETVRIKAFIKRMLQLAVTHSPPFICGVLIVISEVIRSKPKQLLKELLGVTIVEDKKGLVPINSMDNDLASGTTSGGVKSVPGERYNPMSRNPLFCGAEFTHIWEFQVLRRHYHPSVARFTECILENKPLDYAGDPFEDFTSIHFLDRFVYRNPKKRDGDNGMLTAKDLSVLSEQYLRLPERAIPDDEKFLHKYLIQRLKTKKQLGHEDVEVESVSDGEFEDFLDDFEKSQGVDQDLDFAGAINEDEEERESLPDDASLFGDKNDDESDYGDDFAPAEKDALDAAFHSSDDEVFSNEEGLDEEMDFDDS